ncbi:MAG: hypothetical protein A2V86_12360 [Deltaproteobacteria bacterium RBG_16_49_23]|nr:MAG: hypothetical protein A2V86_12360 [Deltaproteobacteria bacterium RBG_16_49_23]
MTAFQKRLWIGLLIMALLTPLGILFPKLFKAGEAWGEWGVDQVERLVGYVPDGLKKLADLWKAPIPDYNFVGESSSMTSELFSYIVSGLIGIAACVIVFSLISRLIAKAKHGK